MPFASFVVIQFHGNSLTSRTAFFHHEEREGHEGFREPNFVGSFVSGVSQNDVTVRRWGVQKRAFIQRATALNQQRRPLRLSLVLLRLTIMRNVYFALLICNARYL